MAPQLLFVLVSEEHVNCSPDYVSLQFSHYHFPSKKNVYIVLYHIFLYNIKEKPGKVK
jgi:hypothetical protein